MYEGKLLEILKQDEYILPVGWMWIFKEQRADAGKQNYPPRPHQDIQIVNQWNSERVGLEGTWTEGCQWADVNWKIILDCLHKAQCNQKGP